MRLELSNVDISVIFGALVEKKINDTKKAGVSGGSIRNAWDAINQLDKIITDINIQVQEQAHYVYVYPESVGPEPKPMLVTGD